jgi:hypothetical protein
MRTSDSLAELLPALIAARKVFAPVRRESTAQIGASRSYHYADLATLLEAVLQPLLDHGLLVVQAVDAPSSTLITRVLHVSGQWVECDYPLLLDQPPQALGSSLTYGRRYSLQALLCLAAPDDDGAAAQPAKRPPREAVPKPSKGIKATPDGPQPAPPPDVAPAPPPRPPAIGRISPAQARRLWAICDHHGWSRADVKAWLIERYAVSSSNDLPIDEYDAIIRHLEAGPPPAPVPNDLAF